MKSFQVLFLNNLRLLWATRSTIVATIGFALLISVLTSFAFRFIVIPTATVPVAFVGGLWLGFLFISTVALTHCFLPERENLAMLGVLLSGVDAGVVYLAKRASSWIFISFLGVLYLLFLSLFLNVSIAPVAIELFLLILLGSLAFSALGTILASISIVSRERDILLPLILYPLLIPVFVGLISLSFNAFENGTLETGGFWLQFLCVFNLVSLVLSWALFEFTLKE